MVAINIISFLIAISLCLQSLKWARREPNHAKYFLALRVFGLLFVSVALYRSVFVSSYPNRLAWFDTIFNSPLVIRCLACLAELSFIGMIAAVLLKLNGEMAFTDGRSHGKQTNAVLAKSPLVAVGCIFVAQFFAFAGLITQYHTLFAIEETLWALAFLSITPLIAIRLRQLNGQNSGSYRPFLIIMAVWCVGYLAFQCLYALPFIHFANISQDVGKLIPPDALRQAIFNYTATRNFDTWGGIGFFIWHSCYFSVCVWMVLFFMSAPRRRNNIA